MLIGFLVHILSYKDAEDKSTLYQRLHLNGPIKRNQAINELIFLARAPSITMPS
jgi:hypothetical protein